MMLHKQFTLITSIELQNIVKNRYVLVDNRFLCLRLSSHLTVQRYFPYKLFAFSALHAYALL